MILVGGGGQKKTSIRPTKQPKGIEQETRSNNAKGAPTCK